MSLLLILSSRNPEKFGIKPIHYLKEAIPALHQLLLEHKDRMLALPLDTLQLSSHAISINFNGNETMPWNKVTSEESQRTPSKGKKDGKARATQEKKTLLGKVFNPLERDPFIASLDQGRVHGFKKLDPDESKEESRPIVALRAGYMII